MAEDLDKQNTERVLFRRLLGFFLFPIALFPFLSILTYDWRDISYLSAPPLTPPANIIGIVGAWSVFIGYTVVGLALWLIPLLFIFIGMLLLCGRWIHPGRRSLWLILVIASFSCLLQLCGEIPMIHSILDSLNLGNNAGGAIGYFIMTRLLARWLSPIGAGILMGCLICFALVMTIGVRNIFTAIAAFMDWLTQHRPALDEDRAAGAEDDIAVEDPREAKRLRKEAERAKREQEREAIRAAREEARRQREEERQRDEETRRQDEEARAREKEARRQREEERNLARQREEEKRAAAARAATEEVPAVNTPPTEPENDDDTEDDATQTPQYELPPLSLLDPLPQSTADHGDIDDMKSRLIDTLAQFNVPAEIVGTVPGPVVTQYELRPASHIKVERIASLSSNLQMALEAKSLRIEAPIPGKNAVGVEIPNRKASPVSFREIIESPRWKSNAFALPLCLGKDAAGNDLVVDLAKSPHMLVAGSTGSGKSVCLNAIINGFLMSRTPSQLRLILVDPKRVEFTSYNALPHLLVPVINDSKKVVFGLRWAVNEMDKRLKLLHEVNCRDIAVFNARRIQKQAELFDNLSTEDDEKDEIPDHLAYIVIIIDEVADIMATAGKEVEPVIARLTALSRATGIHLILATQRPDVKVITGTIKSNIPGRIAFKVAQGNDSRTILDAPGAEDLIGNGDMLYLNREGQLIRAQGAWISDNEVSNIVQFINEHATPSYDKSFAGKLDRIKETKPADLLDDDESDGDSEAAPAERPTTAESDDAMLNDAIDVIRRTRRASISHLQRRMGIGYNKAARLIDLLEDRGIIGAAQGAGPREILIDLDAVAEENSSPLMEDDQSSESEDSTSDDGEA